MNNFKWILLAVCVLYVVWPLISKRPEKDQ